MGVGGRDQEPRAEGNVRDPRTPGDVSSAERHSAADFDVTSADVVDAPHLPFSAGSSSGGGSGGSPDVSGLACPDRVRLELIAAGAPADPSVEEHLKLCPVCREVVRRLRADNELLNDFVTANRDRFDAESGRQRVPGPMDVVPGFRVEGEIHRGAQGVVYRAQQVSTRRNVALKTLLQGKFATSRQRARFEREVEVVASLRHPHIVTLYESGRTDDGLAFFAMELVNGRPLSDILKLPEGVHDKPTVEQLLRTFLSIVKAIAYAHQRGVIHRDLKPANILIDDALDPHVLDFGLARSARGEEDQDMIEATAAGEFLGTFAYAAPEQLRGNPDLIDVRTDVFALGAILYEILAGERPYKPPGGSFSIADLLLARLETEPKAPSTVRSGIDADLDLIALTCLKSKADERYQSAQALADDLERFVEGRPILARRDSLAYVIRKWVLRHRFAALAGVLFAGVVVAFIIGLSVALRNAAVERARAEQTLNAFRDTFQAVNPEIGAGKANMTVLEFLALLRDQAITDAAVDPIVAATLLNTVEASWIGFDSRRPIEALQESLALCREAAERQGLSDTREVAEAIHNLARAYFWHDDIREAERLYREALAMWDRLEEGDGRHGAMTLQHLAACRRQQRDFVEAAALLERAYRVQVKAHGEQSWEVAAVINAQARLLQEQGKSDQALEAFEDARQRIMRAVKPDDFRVGRAHYSVGKLKSALGRPGAIADLAVAERIIVAVKNESSPEAMDARYELALAQVKGGLFDAALALADVAIRAGEPLGELAPRKGDLFELRGRALLGLGRNEEAVTSFREAMVWTKPNAKTKTASRCAEALREAGLIDASKDFAKEFSVGVGGQ